MTTNPNDSSLAWFVQHYRDLSLNDFHDIISLRIEVFVIEQNCPYQELDGKDKSAWHIFAKNMHGQVIATLRIVPSQTAGNNPSIGRVVVKQDWRGIALGHLIMEKAMAFIREEFGQISVKLSAQEHLQSYYERHGFQRVTEMYLEDEIPHVGMVFIPE